LTTTDLSLLHVRFPRPLESEGITDAIRLVLAEQRALLWRDLLVPVITVTTPMKNLLREIMVKRQILCGYDAIAERLQREKNGIENVQERYSVTYGERVSRLLLFSNDGAERLYRHIELLLLSHAPRLIGCRLNVDSATLGKMLTGKEKTIKVILTIHKDVVSAILRTIII
jgi:hypothetical protein